MSEPATVPARPRSPLTLRAILVGVTAGAFVYVALIGLVVVSRIMPLTSGLQEQSVSMALEYQRTSRRAELLDSTMTDLWRLFRQAREGPVVLDTLERHRQVMQQMEDSSRTLERLALPPGPTTALRDALARGSSDEANVRLHLLGAIAALELGDVPLGEKLLQRADSLDTPLKANLAEATTLALLDVRRQEAELAEMAVATSRLLLIWLGVGVIVLPLLVVFVRRRLYEPLGRLDRAMAQVATGDLDVALTPARDDELGRLMEHFDAMTSVLRQRAAEARQRVALETAARTRLILDAALDAVIVIDARGVVREWNPQAETVFGWGRDEVIGTRLASSIIPLEFRDVHTRGLERLLEGGAPVMINRRIETSAVRRDGSRIRVELTITPLEQDGQVEFSAFVRDVTEQRRAQEALAASEERYRAAFEQAAVGMTETAVDGRFMRVNRAFTEITGRSVEELLQLTVSDISHPDDVAPDSEATSRLIRGEESFVQREKRYLRPDGSIAWVSVASGTVRHSGNDAPYILTIIRDVTEQKRLEADLRLAQKMDAVGRLAGGIAHDFNNLLAAIIGYADLLQHHQGATPMIREDARAIVSSAKRGAELARNLLALARRNPVKLVALDFDEVIREVAGLVTRTFDRRITVRLQLHAAHAVVNGDRTELSGALLNMALNARDAMPQGGTLTFATSVARLDGAFWRGRVEQPAPGEYLVVSVRDTGSGMNDETRSRVFEPFFTTKETGKGTGLGLAMVYGTVLQHRGFIDVASVPGQGTDFTLYFPCGDPAELHVPERVQQPVSGSGRILLAEDEEAVRAAAARMLEGLGYQVEAVTNGEEVVQRVQEAAIPYDLVIVDGNMPRLSGRDAAGRIRRLDPSLPVLLVSGYLEQALGDDPENAAPFSGIIGKPFTLLQLSQVVRRHVRKAIG